MDPASLIGLGIAFGAILLAIILEGSSPMSVVLIPPMILVILGTIGAGFTGIRMADLPIIINALIKALTGKAVNMESTIDIIVSLAEKARREGLLALEDAAKDVDDKFLKDGLQAAIDGADPEDLREMLHSKIDTKKATDKVGAAFFATAGGYAPTVGIIGTVVSLVHVLENLSEPAKLGHMIAAALVATFWGLLTANIILLPLSARLKRLSETEAAQMELVVEGLMAVQAGANPRLVGQRLRSLVPETGKAKAAA
ncbi:chemotaxis protein MotA [Quadrisphaera granulorum]|uniref:Chemotaxis protein MotA n=1 Tax=Quadrisphaera granulorum TaxID=317664 RepID=A0A316A4I2_9ACTN|nr:MotA/TolQ/ExbB proton channel family protein [Quadrisphaera granulorum]PWJ52585.1 chemotaxis protein MotA [Quadrisphaera granulorum]SZE97635.1 chemotaxis protein MotA [Quadrisphaera granulorum]